MNFNLDDFSVVTTLKDFRFDKRTAPVIEQTNETKKDLPTQTVDKPFG
jgi:hypothetical protein